MKRAELGSHDLNAAFDDVAAAVMRDRDENFSEAPQTHRRQRWPARRFGTRGLALLGAGVVLAGAGAVAAAGVIDSAYTGKRSTGANAHEAGPGQFLRTDAPNFCRAALAQDKGVVYPTADAKSWESWVLITELNVRHVTRSNPCGSALTASNGQGVQTTTGAVGGYFAQSAFCAWVYDWSDAARSGQQARARAARREIDAAPDWPAVRAEANLPGVERYTAGQAPPVHPPRMFSYLQRFIAAVDAGDGARVDHLISSGVGIAGCPYFVPKPGSHGGSVNPVSGTS